MRRLILMRHAKSDWSAGAMSDHDRPLNPRGAAAAAKLGAWLEGQGIIPDEVFCSSAERTRETFLRLGLPKTTDVTITRDLYLATEDGILDVLRRGTKETLLVVGHNPGIGSCASNLVAAPVRHPQFEPYPSGAILLADFDIDTWAQAEWGNATARHFVVPRDL